MSPESNSIAKPLHMFFSFLEHDYYSNTIDVAMFSVFTDFFSMMSLLLYTVMALLVWPYVEYHDLRVRAGLFLQTNYPLFVKRMENYWQSVKVFGKGSSLCGKVYANVHVYTCVMCVLYTHVSVHVLYICVCMC